MGNTFLVALGSSLLAVVLAAPALAQSADLPIRRGDTNIDRTVDLSDVIDILGFLFLGDPLSCRAAADTNHDLQLDISDPSFLINSLFLGGPAPDPLPIPSCPSGMPATDLDCGSYCTCEELFFGVVYCGRIAAAADPCSIGLHHFAAEGGDQIRVRAISPGEVDLVVEVYDPSGTLLDSGGGAGSFTVVLDFPIPAPGDHKVTVRDDDGRNAGRYCISIERLNNPARSRPLVFGDPRFAAQITQLCEMDLYSFVAASGDLARISATSPGEIDLLVEVFGAAGARLKSAGGAGAFDVQLDCPITSSGTYYILVEDADGLSEGAYSIGLTR